MGGSGSGLGTRLSHAFAEKVCKTRWPAKDAGPTISTHALYSIPVAIGLHAGRICVVPSLCLGMRALEALPPLSW